MPTKKTTTKKTTAKKPTAKRITKAQSERQTRARTDVYSDSKRKAKLPGRRVSASGNVYYERRDNRSDTSLEINAFKKAAQKAKKAAARKSKSDRRTKTRDDAINRRYRLRH